MGLLQRNVKIVVKKYQYVSILIFLQLKVKLKFVLGIKHFTLVIYKKVSTIQQSGTV